MSRKDRYFNWAAGIVSLEQMRMYKKLAHHKLEFDAQPTQIELVYGEY